MARKSLVSDSEFWYKLKVDYKKIASKPDPLRELLLDFFKGKKAHVEKKVGNPKRFLKQVSKVPEKELREILFSIYVNHMWDEGKSGAHYVSAQADSNNRAALASKIDEVLNEMKSEPKIVIEESIEGYNIVWKVKEQVVDEKDAEQNRVVGRRFLPVEPAMIKINDEWIEVRGKQSSITLLEKTFETKGIQEKRHQIDSKPIAAALTSALENENPFFDVIGIRYLESNLPARSKLTLYNEAGVSKDIHHLSDLKAVVPSAFTDISRIALKFKKMGKIVRLKIKHEPDYFFFDIDDKKTIESERQEIKQYLESAFDISLEKRYDYSAQYDEKFIFHQILAGNHRVYKKYYEGLSLHAKDAIDKFVEIETIFKNICNKCDREFGGGDECPYCQSSEYHKNSYDEIKLKSQEIFSFVLEKMTAYSNRQLNGLKIDTVEVKTISDVSVIYFPVHITEYAGRQDATRFYQFSVCVVGNDSIPDKVDDYMLDAFLVTYGSAASVDSYNNAFGVIDLYSLIDRRGSSILDELIKKAIQLSIKHLESRVVEASKAARARLERIARNERYTAKNFERDIFCLLKRMFPYSQRWGREGVRETDGIILFAHQGDDYFVASYDPKFTRRKEGYELGVGEQNKALYYILDENDNEDIKKISRKNGISAHILVSNKFNEKQFESYGTGMKNFVRLLKSSDDLKVSVIFLTAQQLLYIYRIYETNWDAIKGSLDFHGQFFESVSKLLTTEDEFKPILQTDIQEFEQDILRIKGAAKYSRPIKEI